MLWRSDDGGVEWVPHNMKNVHDDLHGFWIDPHDPDHLVLGGDGGLNVSVDGGATWSQTPLPIAQFYDLDVDIAEPYWVYGGMQDTASWTGPSRTYDNEGITDHDWIKLRSQWRRHGDPSRIRAIRTSCYLAQNSGNLVAHRPANVDPHRAAAGARDGRPARDCIRSDGTGPPRSSFLRRIPTCSMSAPTTCFVAASAPGRRTAKSRTTAA